MKKELTVLVDFGGTKTHLQTFLGNRLIKNETIPSNSFLLKTQIHQFLRRSNSTPRKGRGQGWGQVASIIIGMRGVWTSAEKNVWRKKLRFLATHVEVVSDIELAYRRVFGTSEGIILNAGTGSIAYGRSKSGKTARAGGMGPLIGDEGSAFWIGKEFLKRATPEKTKLLKIRSYAKNPEAIKKIAAIAKKVLKISARHAVAKKIIHEAQEHLRTLIEQVRTQLQLKSPPIKLVGGLFQNKPFRKKFETLISRPAPLS